MTPEERAEKVWNSYMTKDQFIVACAAQIAEAQREAKVDAAHSELKAHAIGRRDGQIEGFAAAKAKAAGVARMGRACGCPDPACAGNLIAASIEALEP